jgi:hypothetical protein
VSGGQGIREATAFSQAVASVVSQDPDGIGWISNWGPNWDGVPNCIVGVPTSEQCNWVFPQGSGDVMRGLRQRFYEVNPYADVTNPTVAEIDYWNIEVIRHFRRLIGNTVPINPDACLFLKAQWSEEHFRSTVWDSVSGFTCTGSTNPHCGDGFIPPCTDQAPYLTQYPGLTCCGATAGSGGIGSTNTNIPWSIKLSRIIKGWWCSGDAHGGPFLSRTKAGMSFWNANGGNSQSVRFKWSG